MLARLGGAANRPLRTLLARAFRYGVVGLLSTVLYFGAVALLVEAASAGPVLAAGVATVLVVITSYAMNRRWVFDTDRPHAWAFSRFVAASVLSIALNTGVMYVSVRALRWWYVAGLVLATGIVPPTNFVINYLWCFRPAARRVP
jgi:putative flippase GtrA